MAATSRPTLKLLAALIAITGVFLSALAAPPADPITNIDTWARIVRYPATRPLDIVIIAGDSTIVVNGGDQARGMHEAFGARYPSFATAFLPLVANDGSGSVNNMRWDGVEGIAE